jgi:hypothetical protein
MTVEIMMDEKLRAEDRETCSICQFPVGMDEKRTQCPDCGLPFHAECWEENFGCSAYGCPQVNALKPAAPQQGVAGSPVPSKGALAPQGVVPPSEPFPWDYLLLAASGLGALGSLFAFGLPSAVMLAVVLGSRFSEKNPFSRSVFLLAVAVCLVGAIGGAIAAHYLGMWLGARN